MSTTLLAKNGRYSCQARMADIEGERGLSDRSSKSRTMKLSSASDEVFFHLFAQGD